MLIFWSFIDNDKGTITDFEKPSPVSIVNERSYSLHKHLICKRGKIPFELEMKNAIPLKMRGMILFLLFILGCNNCTIDRSKDDLQFIKRRTGLSLESCTKQLFREQTDFSLEVKYLVTTPHDFITQNQAKQQQCSEIYDSIFHGALLKQNLTCFGEKDSGWYASINMDSSYCTVMVSFQDFAGQ